MQEIHPFESEASLPPGWTDSSFDFFQEARADFFTQDNEQTTIFHLLTSKKSLIRLEEKIPSAGVKKRFEILLAMGFDPMAENARQRTGLDIAAACDPEHLLEIFA